MPSFGTKLGGIALGAAGALALGGTWLVSAEAQELTHITYITANSASCTGTYAQWVGPDFGIAEAVGQTWEGLNSETTIPFVAFLDTGDADLVILDSAQVLQMAAAEQPNSVVYEHYSYSDAGIVVPADSPIKSLADLRDLTVGLASDRDLITTIITLDSIGETVESANIKTVVVGDAGPVMANALSSGAIQAFAGGASDRGNIIAAGIAINNITPPAVSENPPNSWVMADARMEEGWAGPFLRGWAMAQHAGLLDMQAVAAVCRQRAPEQWENPEVGANHLFSSVYTYQLQRGVKRGELRPWVWERIQGPYVKIGEIDAPIPVEEFLDDRFIDYANDYETYDVVQIIEAWKEANQDMLVP